MIGGAYHTNADGICGDKGGIMSEENTTQETQAESAETEVQDQQEQVQDVVPKSELDKVLSDMHKFKKMAREYETKMKEQEMSKLKEQQEWQKIAEIKEKEAAEAVEEANKLKSSFLNTQKYNAIKSAALASGIRKEALNDLELLDFDDDVAIETTNTGKINVLGADAAIKKLKADRPYWFGKSMNSVNTDSPGVSSGGEITMEKLLKVKAAAGKSGDYKEYEKVLRAYQAQQRA